MRRLHVDEDVPLKKLARLSGLSVSMLSKVVLGQRRKGAGGPVRGKRVN